MLCAYCLVEPRRVVHQLIDNNIVHMLVWKTHMFSYHHKVVTKMSNVEMCRKIYESDYNAAVKTLIGLRMEQSSFLDGTTNGMFLDEAFATHKAAVAKTKTSYDGTLRLHCDVGLTDFAPVVDESMTMRDFAVPYRKGNVRYTGATKDYTLLTIARELCAFSGGTVPYDEALAQLATLRDKAESNDDITESIRGLFRAVVQTGNKDFVFVDIETTGFDPTYGDIIEVGVVTTDSAGNVTGENNILCDVAVPESKELYGVGAEHIHNISAEMIDGLPTFPQRSEELAQLLNNPDNIVVAHNTNFEGLWFSHTVDGFWNNYSVFSHRNAVENASPNYLLQDTQFLCALFLDTEHNTLEFMANKYGLDYSKAHRASEDAMMTAQAFFAFLDDMGKK